MASLTKPAVHVADISKWQDKVDLVEARKHIDVICLRATLGKTYVDPKFAVRLTQARKLGFKVGAYHFADANSSAKEQALHFLKVADVRPGDLRPMLDIEDNDLAKSYFSRMSVTARTRWVGEFIYEVVKATGVAPFVYTKMELAQNFNAPLWSARYPRVFPWNRPKVQRPWNAWTLWQFSDKELVPGLGKVDVSTWNGDPKRLLEAFTVKAKPSPVVVKPTLPGLAPRPVPAKAKSVTVRIGTANIQNFGAKLSDGTDMLDSDVRKDVATTAEHVDLAGYQEIAEAADHKALIEVLGKDFSVTAVTTETPIAARQSLLKPVGAPKVTKISDKLVRPPGQPGPAIHSPARYMTEQRYTWTFPTDLPDVVVLNNHYIQSAFNPAPGALKAARVERWNIGHKVHGARALELRKQGFIVVGTADWNRQGKDVPKFATDQIWVVGGDRGIDAAYVLAPRGVTVKTAGAFKAFPLNSDHDLKVNTVTFTRQ